MGKIIKKIKDKIGNKVKKVVKSSKRTGEVHGTVPERNVSNINPVIKENNPVINKNNPVIKETQKTTLNNNIRSII